jgi:phosphoribosylformylglycinamidine synthase
MEVKEPNNSIYIVGQTFKELGGSEYYKIKGFLGKTVPKVRAIQAKKTFRAISRAIDLGLLKACHDLSEGGLAVAAAEMAFSGGYGIELHLQKVPVKDVNRNDFILFSESNSRFLVEVSEKTKNDFEALMKGKVSAEIGKVTKTPKLCIYGLDGNVVVDAALNDLLASWKGTLSGGV